MKTKFRNRCLSVLLSLVLLLPSFQMLIVSAYTLSDEDEAKISAYKQEQAELNEKIEENKAKLNEKKSDIEDQKAYISDLTDQISVYQQKIDVLNDQISALESQKDAIQEKVDELNAQIQEIEEKINHNELEQISLEQQSEDIVEDLKECLCDLYMQGTSSELELLLSAKSFSSFLITLELTSNMAKHDDELINNLKVSIAKIEEIKAEQEILIEEIEEKKEEYNSQINALDSKQADIESSRDELEASQNEVNELYSEATSYLDILDEQSEEYEMLVEKYEAEIDAFEKKIDSIIANASKGSGKVSGKGFIWPLQYSDVYISSYFGYRTHPLTGTVRLHGGVDTCCSSGTYGKAISAAAAGTVIISTWHSSYGYYVGIDHGNGVVTVYAHNSQLLVSVGQQVSQGQTIAYAGNSGDSSGPHCHFEVRINGERVNPLNYVSP